MMNKWLKFENYLNRLLTNLAKFFTGLTPSTIKTFYKNFKLMIGRIITKLLTLPEILMGPGKKWLKRKLSVVITFILAKKETFAGVIKSIQSFKVTSDLPIAAYQGTKSFISKNLLMKLAAVSPAKAVGVTCAATAFSLTGISVYQNIKEIEKKTAPQQVRKIASEDELAKQKWSHSKFRHAQNKIIFLRGLNIPIYIKNRDGMRNLLIDAMLETDNRYTAKYFYKPENEILIRDRLNESLQAVVPNFPLEPEGKKIIKEKIRFEVNKLIKDLKIKGKVERVYINSILNG